MTQPGTVNSQRLAITQHTDANLAAFIWTYSFLIKIFMYGHRLEFMDNSTDYTQGFEYSYIVNREAQATRRLYDCL